MREGGARAAAFGRSSEALGGRFVLMMARVNAGRIPIDLAKAQASIKMIDKDVPRTDRKGGYFCDEHPHRLKWLRDILITFAVFHQEVGYAQGMNDVLSMILAVMDDEPKAYLCFENYLATIQADFMAVGMLEKLEKLKSLLMFMDPELHRHLELHDAGDMVFCHRWLLLTFKREFEFDDAVRCSPPRVRSPTPPRPRAEGRGQAV